MIKTLSFAIFLLLSVPGYGYHLKIIPSNSYTIASTMYDSAGWAVYHYSPKRNAFVVDSKPTSKTSELAVSPKRNAFVADSKPTSKPSELVVGFASFNGGIIGKSIGTVTISANIQKAADVPITFSKSPALTCSVKRTADAITISNCEPKRPK